MDIIVNTGERDCFSNPIPEIYEAALLLEAAVEAHCNGNSSIAASCLKLADMPIIGEWLDSIWLGGNPHVRRVRKVSNLAPVLPQAERYQLRNPHAAMKRALIERDGHHCRFCAKIKNRFITMS